MTRPQLTKDPILAWRSIAITSGGSRGAKILSSSLPLAVKHVRARIFHQEPSLAETERGFSRIYPPLEPNASSIQPSSTSFGASPEWAATMSLLLSRTYIVG
jgi:hypothetical protein